MQLRSDVQWRISACHPHGDTNERRRRRSMTAVRGRYLQLVGVQLLVFVVRQRTQ
jgi:hypothetical protein